LKQIAGNLSKVETEGKELTMLIRPIGTGVEMLAKRMLWLAYQSSRVVGMGFLQERNDVTEDSLWGTHSRPGRVNTDYAFGRMMKLYFEMNPVGILSHSSREYNPEYQSFCHKYQNIQALAKAAAESLGATVEVEEEVAAAK
jgi:hypothetical protein